MTISPPRAANPRARFDAFVTAHRAAAFRLAWRLVGDEQAARDVTQDAFARAWLALDQFRDEASLKTWFTRILVRQASNHRRWRNVRARAAGFLGLESTEPDRGDPMIRARIGRALDTLSVGQRAVFVLVHLEGHSVAEAALLVGSAEGTVKSHLHRALERMRAELGDLERT